MADHELHPHHSRISIVGFRSGSHSWFDLSPADHRNARFTEHLTGGGATVFDHVCPMGLEGIVSKRVDAPYRRGKGWWSDEPRSPPVGSMSLYTHGADATFSGGIGLQGGGPL